MNLSSHITRLALAIGLDIKGILARLAVVEVQSLRTASSMSAINAATRLIQTQRIIAEQVAKERVK